MSGRHSFLGKGRAAKPRRPGLTGRPNRAFAAAGGRTLFPAVRAPAAGPDGAIFSSRPNGRKRRPAAATVFRLLCAAALGLPLAIGAGCTAKPAAKPKPVSRPVVSVYSAPNIPYSQVVANLFDQSFPHRPFASRFAAARAENSDVVGWVFVPGTTIDLAVTQTGDNAYYLKHGLNKLYKWKGNPFLDYRDRLSPLSRGLILYGHNMGDGDLFGQLKKYESLSFLNAHPLVYFGDGTQNRYFKVFAVFITDVNFYYNRTDFANDADFLGLVRQMQARSFFKTDVDVRASDHLLVFSTCTYEFHNARFVVAARMLRTEEEESPWNRPAVAQANPVGPHGN